MKGLSTLSGVLLCDRAFQEEPGDQQSISELLPRYPVFQISAGRGRDSDGKGMVARFTTRQAQKVYVLKERPIRESVQEVKKVASNHYALIPETRKDGIKAAEIGIRLSNQRLASKLSRNVPT